MNYRIGVDVGGTFTDFTVGPPSGELLLWKEDTTPDDPATGGPQRPARGRRAARHRPRAACSPRTELLVHGTTVATNMLIQRNGPTIGLLCTKGFRDVLYFRDGYKPQRFNMKLPHPQELVDRWLRVGVTERFVPDGSEVAELDEQEVRRGGPALRPARASRPSRSPSCGRCSPRARAARRRDPRRGAARRRRSCARTSCCRRSASGSARPRPR